jgi:hypothetical protein
MQTRRNGPKSVAMLLVMAGLVLTLTTASSTNAGGSDSGGSSGGGDPWENECVADGTFSASDETSTAGNLLAPSGLGGALIVVLQLLVAR